MATDEDDPLIAALAGQPSEVRRSFYGIMWGERRSRRDRAIEAIEMVRKFDKREDVTMSEKANIGVVGPAQGGEGIPRELPSGVFGAGGGGVRILGANTFIAMADEGFQCPRRGPRRSRLSIATWDRGRHLGIRLTERITTATTSQVIADGRPLTFRAQTDRPFGKSNTEVSWTRSQDGRAGQEFRI